MILSRSSGRLQPCVATMLLLLTSFLCICCCDAKVKPWVVDGFEADEIVQEFDGIEKLLKPSSRSKLLSPRELRAKKSKTKASYKGVKATKDHDSAGNMMYETKMHPSHKRSKTKKNEINRGKALKSNTNKAMNQGNQDIGSCSIGGELFAFMDSLEKSLKKANLPTIDVHQLANYILSDENMHPQPQGLWDRYLIHKTNSAHKCFNSRPMEIKWISRSMWCMNIKSTLAHKKQGHGHEGIMKRRRVQSDTSGQITGSTCAQPGGSYMDSCTSVSYSPLPDLSGTCNLVALCKNTAGSEYNVWNKGNWSAMGDVPQLYNNDNGCVSSNNPGTTWSRFYCSPDIDCPVPEVFPPGCLPSMIGLLANETCLLTVACESPIGSTYDSLIAYEKETVPNQLYLFNNTYCLAEAGLFGYLTDDFYTLLYCKLACGVPSGTWGDIDSNGNALCSNIQITPYPRSNGMCSLSAICGNGVSNRGTYSPNGKPPYLSLNPNSCIDGPNEMCYDGSESGWAREFCISPSSNNKCVPPGGSYLEDCENRMYMGPDINGACAMSMNCKAHKNQGVAQNVVSYAMADDFSLMTFAVNEDGCLWSGANATVNTTWWSRTQCTWYEYNAWQTLGSWWNSLSITEEVFIWVTVAVAVIATTVMSGGSATEVEVEAGEVVSETVEEIDAEVTSEGGNVIGEVSDLLEEGGAEINSASTMGDESTICSTDGSCERRRLKYGRGLLGNCGVKKDRTIFGRLFGREILVPVERAESSESIATEFTEFTDPESGGDSEFGGDGSDTDSTGGADGTDGIDGSGGADGTDGTGSTEPKYPKVDEVNQKYKDAFGERDYKRFEKTRAYEKMQKDMSDEPMKVRRWKGAAQGWVWELESDPEAESRANKKRVEYSKRVDEVVKKSRTWTVPRFGKVGASTTRTIMLPFSVFPETVAFMMLTFGLPVGVTMVVYPAVYAAEQDDDEL